MCVWSAYAGKKAAAPEVLKCGKRIEGLWSGFYSGIVTMDDSGIHRARCCGWSKYWEDRFSVEDLPGTVGFFHSRTFSGGDESWAHPFVATAGKVALISQGSDGVFNDMSCWSAMADRLIAAGKDFPSKNPDVDVKRYPRLATGECVHVSEVRVNAVEYFYEMCHDPMAALKKTAEYLNEEDISLFIFRDHPDRIYFVNMNQRGVVHFAPDGAYASTTTLAFGQPQVKYVEIPLNCAGYFSCDDFYFEKLPAPPYPFYDFIPDGCLRTALDHIRANPGKSLSKILDDGFGDLFPPDGIKLRAVAAYHVAETLIAQDWVRLQHAEVPGACGTNGIRTTFFSK